MTTPLIDVIIPVHDTARPVARAIESVRRSPVPMRVTVVLHGIDERPDGISGDDVRFVHVDDGIQSPSGPRNAGLKAAAAPWVCFVDSDDVLGEGALEAMLDVGQRLDAEVVLPVIQTRSGRLRTPLRVPRSAGILDIERNDLHRRSHCFGLISRELLARTGACFPEHVRTAEDLVFMAQLYSRGRVASAPLATYFLRDDVADRVTNASLRPEEQVAFIEPMVASRWFGDLGQRQRDLLVRRVLATNLAGMLRTLAADEPPAAFRSARARLLDAAPGAARLLSLQDAATLEMRPAAGALRRVLATRPFAALPATGAGLLDPVGPLRATAALVRTRLRPRIHYAARVRRRVRRAGRDATHAR